MELVFVISVVVIFYYIIYTFQKRNQTNSNTVVIEEWHNLTPISQRFISIGIDSGYVYFVEESGNKRVKIGKAKSPEKRMQNDFGTKMPYDFKIVHLIKSENHHKTETLFHDYFKDKRYKGEWFNLTQDDIKWIRNEDFPREIADSIKGY